MLALAAVAGVPGYAAVVAFQDPTSETQAAEAKAKLEETRITLSKWIETQQLISKERKDWQQSREILQGRLEVVRTEVAALEARILEAESKVAEANKKRDELIAENEALKGVGGQLAAAATTMEAELRKLIKSVPEPLQAAPKVLLDRMPTDPETTKVSAAERYQNVLGILNALNKANTEVTVSYEVHTLADGKPSEVRAIYIGLAQAYYVSSDGQAGIGRPTSDGWKWEPANQIAGDVVTALEILQGKHSPSFVPLPVTIQ
jgi:hypothetical protein